MAAAKIARAAAAAAAAAAASKHHHQGTNQQAISAIFKNTPRGILFKQKGGCGALFGLFFEIFFLDMDSKLRLRR